MQIAERIQQIEESQSLRMAARSRELQAQGISMISMSLGEPDMDTPLPVQQAARQAVTDHWSHYGETRGLRSLREAVATRHSAAGAIRYEADDVMISVGAKMAICTAIQTLLNPGDEVVLPQPCWVSYSEMAKLAGAAVVNIPTRAENRYCLTPDELERAITPRTRLLILCSPNNPTGSVYTRAETDALVRVLERHPEVAVLSDEIYAPLVYGVEPVSLSLYPQLADRLILVNGVSKAYAMTGYRIGWLLCSDRAFLNACVRLQGQQITCATMVAQRAAEAALRGDQQCVETMRRVFAERRELICRLAKEIPGWRVMEPDGAFYLFPDVSYWFGRTLHGRLIRNGDDVAEYLLEEAHVACVPGSAFGCNDCIRLSYAISTEQITEGMRRIREAFEEK